MVQFLALEITYYQLAAELHITVRPTTEADFKKTDEENENKSLRTSARK